MLDKSRADWKDFKKTDEQIEEELELHKRSGAQYLDKQVGPGALRAGWVEGQRGGEAEGGLGMIRRGGAGRSAWASGWERHAQWWRAAVAPAAGEGRGGEG